MRIGYFQGQPVLFDAHGKAHTQRQLILTLPRLREQLSVFDGRTGLVADICRSNLEEAIRWRVGMIRLLSLMEAGAHAA